MSCEQRLHVLDVADRHADLADLAARERVIGVVAGLRRQIERDREAGLALGEVGAVELVARARRGVPGVGPEHPGPLALGCARGRSSGPRPQVADKPTETATARHPGANVRFAPAMSGILRRADARRGAARRRARRLRADGALLAAQLPREPRLRPAARGRHRTSSSKFYRPERWSREAILEEHRFLADLRARGDPGLRAAAVRRRRDAARDRGHPLRASGVAPAGARPTSWATRSSRSSGRLLARIHNVGRASRRAKHRQQLDAATSALAPLRFLEPSGACRPRAGAATARSVDAGGRALRRAGARAFPCTGSTATAISATCCTATKAGSSSTSTTS